MKDQLMRFAIDDMLVDGITDFDRMEFPMSMLLPAATPEAIAPYRSWLEPDHYDARAGEWHLACHSILLRFGNRIVLVDTCVGCGKSREARPTWHRREDNAYLDRFAALGVSPEQVDTVFCTHLHVDHVGWNTRLHNGRWVPTFPNARYLMGRTEMAHWQERAGALGAEAVNHGAYVDSVLPVVEAGQADLVDDGYEVADGMTLGMLTGHTPGQMGLFVKGRSSNAVFCGDAIHSPVQIARPEWSTAFCTDPVAAARTRLGILEHAAEHGDLVVPAHFRGVGHARITRKGNAFEPIFPAT